MDLALAIGGMTVGEMLVRMSDDELAGWVAYAKKNGLPVFRQERYLAQIAQVTAGGKLDDFILKPATAEDSEPVNSGASAAHAFSAIAGARVHYLRLPKGGESWPAA